MRRDTGSLDPAEGQGSLWIPQRDRQKGSCSTSLRRKRKRCCPGGGDTSEASNVFLLLSLRGCLLFMLMHILVFA